MDTLSFKPFNLEQYFSDFLLSAEQIATAVVLAPNIFVLLEGVEVPKLLPVKVCENGALDSGLGSLSRLPTPFVFVASRGLITSLRNEKSALAGLLEKPAKLPKALVASPSSLWKMHLISCTSETLVLSNYIHE